MAKAWGDTLSGETESEVLRTSQRNMILSGHLLKKGGSVKSFSRASKELILSPSNHRTEVWRVNQGHWRVGIRRQLGMGQLAAELSLWSLLFHTHPCLPLPLLLEVEPGVW